MNQEIFARRMGFAVFDEEVCMECHTSNNDIGIKHDFLYIKFCWIPRVSLKPEHENLGF